MVEFNYTAINNKGKTLNGVISAENMEDAVSLLRGKKLYIVDVKENSTLQKDVEILSLKKVKDKDLAFFCRQLSTMLKAGVNILTSLSIIKNQTANKKFASIINDIYEQVEKGNPMCLAMGQHPEAFPPMMVNMVEAGEVGGTIDESFGKMAVYFEKREKLRHKIVNAMIYPVVVLLVAAGVLGVLMIFVIPTFVGMFKEMNVELPLVTRGILGLGQFMRNDWYILEGAIFILVWLYRIYSKSPQGSAAVGKAKLKLPAFGKIIVNTETSSFARTLSMLSNAGVSLVPALYTTQKLFSNQYIAEEFSRVIEGVKGGENLSGPIEDLGIFPQLVPAIIRTGEESGNLEAMLEQLADYYESEVDNSVTRLTALFEPIMIVFLALLVGLMLASIILPMFKMYGSIQ